MDPAALEGWLPTAHPRWESARIESIVEVPGGWESDVYDVLIRLALDPANEFERVAVRRYTGDGAVARREFVGMRHLFDTGYPVPEVLAVEPAPHVLGRPFLVMRWADGQVRSWNRADLGTLARLLSDLHRLAWQPLHVDAGSVAPSATDPLDDWQDHLESFGVRSIESCVRWARRSAPTIDPQPAIVHLDFHTGNVLVGSDGSATVVDWTQVGVADRRFDVAWTELLLSMALGSDAAARFRTAYELEVGALDDIEWFEAVMSLKRLFTVLVSVRVGPEAMGMRAEARERIVRDLPSLAVPWRRVKDITGIDVVEARQLFE